MEIQEQLTLNIRTFGGLAIELDGRPITSYVLTKAEALLIYLAINPRQHPRETLADLLWDERTQQRAMNNLRQVLYRLRKEVGPFVTITRKTVAINPDANLSIDARQLEAAIPQDGIQSEAQAQEAEQALTGYNGDFLAGFFLSEAAEFESWTATQREHLHQLFVDASLQLGQWHLNQQQYPATIATAIRLLQIDPLAEAGHNQLMESLARNNQRDKALAQYEKCCRLLADELDVEPAAATVQLYEQIKAGAFNEVRDEPKVTGKTPNTDSLPPHNLPSQPTPFIGRCKELAKLDTLLADPTVRLVTIVGAGGMGKTRLALASAERQLVASGLKPGPEDGVFFVDLAPLSQVDQMSTALADALNYPLQGGNGRSSPQQFLDYLRHKKMLLLFDNFEHLLDGVELVAEILDKAPDVQILVTSRERLNIRHEQLYPIEGLEFPDLETPSPGGENGNAAEYSAVQLFLQSARRNQPDFTLRDADDLTYLTRICRVVAGMPLALDLAAAWVDMLPLADIAAELLHGLDFLETEMRDQPERHRSVRAAIDYSWKYLTDQEREIFAKLSVFQGGFTWGAAKAVAEANLQQMARLVNKSWLKGGRDGRYQIHELLRQYGSEKLAAFGWETAVQDRHSQFYCTALQTWGAVLDSDQMIRAVQEIEADYHNCKVAWKFAFHHGHLGRILNAVNGLGSYYDASGHWFEGINLYKESTSYLQSQKALSSVETAKLLIMLAAWQVSLEKYARGYYVDALDTYKQILQPAFTLLEKPILAEVDNRAEEAYLRLQIGRVLKVISGKWEAGKEHLTLSYQLYKELGNKSGASDAVYELSFYTLWEALYEEAREQLQEGLDLLSESTDLRRKLRLFIGLSNVARRSGDFEVAADYCERAYFIAREARHYIGMFDARHQAVQLAWNLEQFELAANYGQEAILLARQANSPSRESFGLSSIAKTHHMQGEYELALKIYQEAIDLKKSYSIPNELGHTPEFTYLLVGEYDKVESLIRESSKAIEESYNLIWVHLARGMYAEALSLGNLLLKQSMKSVQWAGELRAAIGLSLFRLGRYHESAREFHQSLRICLQTRNYIDLIFPLSLIPLMLAETADPKQKERAVELWAMAISNPRVANAKLFSDLAGESMEAFMATLPPDMVAAAQARGRGLDWWQTAESLLQELTRTMQKL